MDEIFPGVWHWTAFKQNIGATVSSYLVEPAGALIDPMLPDGGLDAFAQHGRPRVVVLTSGNHTRDAGTIAEALGCPIVTSRAGADRIGGGLTIDTYEDGEEVAPGVRAIHVGVLSDDEFALHLTATEGALAVADGIDHGDGTLGFFPDRLLGDDPAAVKAGLRQRFASLLDLDFDHLLFAHGDPVVGGGKAALRAFATGER